ncbi:hypothetical protein [Fodinicola feengrottensis]|uniref:hypothetical protein n=1 Tax=Fodinicola feengrottensis TaxID=435914 RepID=UPI0036F21753
MTEGDRNIVVTVAGVGADQLASVGQTAQLRFRQVISTVADIPAVTPKPSTSASPKPSGSASPKPGASPSAKTSGAAVNPGPTKKPASSTGKAEIVPAVGTGSAGKAAVVPAANPTPTPSTSATRSHPVRFAVAGSARAGRRLRRASRGQAAQPGQRDPGARRPGVLPADTDRLAAGRPVRPDAGSVHHAAVGRHLVPGPVQETHAGPDRRAADRPAVEDPANLLRQAGPPAAGLD